MGAFSRILTTTDFTEAAEVGIEHAERLARDMNAELTLVHVVDSDPPPGIDANTQERILQERRHHAKQSLEDLIEKRESIVATQARVAVGVPSREIAIIAADESVDLIVMSSHGRTALGRLLLGSTAEGVLHRASCPVMIVPFKRTRSSD